MHYIQTRAVTVAKGGMTTLQQKAFAKWQFSLVLLKKIKHVADKEQRHNLRKALQCPVYIYRQKDWLWRKPEVRKMTW